MRSREHTVFHASASGPLYRSHLCRTNRATRSHEHGRWHSRDPQRLRSGGLARANIAHETSNMSATNKRHVLQAKRGDATRAPSRVPSASAGSSKFAPLVGWTRRSPSRTLKLSPRCNTIKRDGYCNKAPNLLTSASGGPPSRNRRAGGQRQAGHGVEARYTYRAQRSAETEKQWSSRPCGGHLAVATVHRIRSTPASGAAGHSSAVQSTIRSNQPKSSQPMHASP